MYLQELCELLSFSRSRRQKIDLGIVARYTQKMRTFLAFLVLLTLLFLFMLMFRQYRNEHGELQQLFAQGTAEPFPDGFYVGTSPSFSVGDWKGKRFDGQMKTGVNIVGEGERFPFRMYVTKGVRDAELPVIKIDYDLPENPWYLRWFAFDEIVRLDDGRYLGKIQLVFLGKPFTIGYFWQVKG